MRVKALSIYFLPLIHVRVAGVLEPTPAVMGLRGGVQLDRSPGCRRAGSGSLCFIARCLNLCVQVFAENG